VQNLLADFNDRASLVDAVSQNENRAVQGVYGVFSLQDFRDGVEVEIQQGKALADAADFAQQSRGWRMSRKRGSFRNLGRGILTLAELTIAMSLRLRRSR
jgi:hypothetical protein